MKVIIVTRIGIGSEQNYQERINLLHVISYKQVYVDKYRVELNLTDGRSIMVCDTVDELDAKINCKFDVA